LNSIKFGGSNVDATNHSVVAMGGRETLGAEEPDGVCGQDSQIPSRKTGRVGWDRDESRGETAGEGIAGVAGGGLGDGVVTRVTREIEGDDGANGGIDLVGYELEWATVRGSFCANLDLNGRVLSEGHGGEEEEGGDENTHDWHERDGGGEGRRTWGNGDGRGVYL